MKTCNNCDTINVVDAVKCSHCKMPDNFTFHEEPTASVATTKGRQVQCRNCGSFEPGKGEQCVHCRFPLPQAGTTHTISKHTIPMSRRVG